MPNFWVVSPSGRYGYLLFSPRYSISAIASALIQTIVMAIFAGAALAIGLALWFGPGKDAAQRILEKTLHNVSE